MGPLPMPDREKLLPLVATVAVVSKLKVSKVCLSSTTAGLCEMELFEDPWLELELCIESCLWMRPWGVPDESKTSLADPEE